MSSLSQLQEDASPEFTLVSPEPPLPDTAPKKVVQRPREQTVSSVLRKVQRDVEAGQHELFGALLGMLIHPIFPEVNLPKDWLHKGALSSDRASVDMRAVYKLEEFPLGPESSDGPDLADRITLWGPALYQLQDGTQMSVVGVFYLQTQVFWESLEELTLHHNEREKWDVLKWMFMPAIRKAYVMTPAGQSETVCTHEYDWDFSFARCSQAAGMDPDVLRELLRQKIPPELLEAVERVCKFD